ncbi:MAG: transglutaminase-like cysteine peptidase, partial [Rhodocyclaceae bacterium]|nr:transglutaminase-like cysteine peptidase [Rhodocyclaceae bacterium]
MISSVSHRLRRLFLLAFVCCLTIPVFALDNERLFANLTRMFGNAGTRNFQDWQKLIDDSRTRNLQDNLRRTNEFFNRRVQFADDQKAWGQADYWATPMETLGKGAGDCEDFAIAKYFSLLNMGVPNEQLRLVYVKARIGGPTSTVMQAHMVLAWYADPDAEPVVLDNLITDIRPASRRTDLQPIFSFNSQGI